MSALTTVDADRPPQLTIDAEPERHAVPPIGRARECNVLDQLATNLRVGHSQALILQGEEGVGKTELLDYLAERAAACHQVRIVGVETEKDLCLAALQQLCGPLLASCEAVPEPQRQALAAAFGARGSKASDKFAIGMAVLELLTAVANSKPLLCIVNNVQWLDVTSAQVLGFVARRLSNRPVAIVMATSDDDSPAMAGVPVLSIRGLNDDDARILLRGSVVGSVDEVVQERLAAEARGNRQTLIQTTAGLSLDSLAGGYGPPLVRVPRRMERALRTRLASVPPSTRQLLLLAAAEPTGAASILWQAAHQLGISHGAAEVAVEERLIEIDDIVLFCHPLLRSVIYDSATQQQRRVAHRALAVATDHQTDPDRRAWHRAQAAADVDEEIALDLERTAHRARERGGLPATAAFHARAAELTADMSLRARRALLAAELKHRAGSSREARRLLAMAQAGPLEEAERARAQFLAARLSVHTRRGVYAPRLMLDAAHACAQTQADVAAIAYGEALLTALTRFGPGSMGPEDVALAVHSSGIARAPGLRTSLLHPAAILFGHGPGAGACHVKRALKEYCSERSLTTDENLSWALLACGLAQELWDDESWLCVSNDLVTAARRSGSLAVLPDALNAASVLTLMMSGTAAAMPLIEEAEAVGRAIESQLRPSSRLLLLALQGRPGEVSALIADASPTAVSLGEGMWLTSADLATAMVNNGAGHYDEALSAAERGAARSDGALAAWCVSELVEAAVRSGDIARAERWLDKLTDRAEGCSTNWALALAARAMALVADGGPAEELYLKSIDQFEGTHVRLELARSRLVYGEWLRRGGRRVDARVQLGLAHEQFIELGLDGFAERARRELVATGGSPRRRTQTATEILTAQEAQIARLARDGRSNSEIGVELYLSHRTVEWHLRKVFMKLGIASRRQLEKALPR